MYYLARASLLLLPLFLLAPAWPAVADQPQDAFIATVFDVRGALQVARAGARAPLKSGDGLYWQDSLEIGPQAAATVLFRNCSRYEIVPRPQARTILLSEISPSTKSYREKIVTLMSRGSVPPMTSVRVETAAYVQPILLTPQAGQVRSTRPEIAFMLPSDEGIDRLLLVLSDREGMSLCESFEAKPRETYRYTLRELELERGKTYHLDIFNVGANGEMALLLRSRFRVISDAEEQQVGPVIDGLERDGNSLWNNLIYVDTCLEAGLYDMAESKIRAALGQNPDNPVLIHYLEKTMHLRREMAGN